MLSLIAALALAGAEPAADAPARSIGATDCSQPGKCRTVGKIVIHPAGQTPLTFNINRTLPWIAEGNLVLFPGEAVVFRLEDQSGRLTPVLVVGGGEARTRTLAEGEVRVSFDEREGQVFVSLESSREKAFHYGLVMVTQDGRASATSVCTVRPGLRGFEHWPHPIVQLAFANFVDQADDGIVCR